MHDRLASLVIFYHSAFPRIGRINVVPSSGVTGFALKFILVVLLVVPPPPPPLLLVESSLPTTTVLQASRPPSCRSPPLQKSRKDPTARNTSQPSDQRCFYLDFPYYPSADFSSLSPRNACFAFRSHHPSGTLPGCHE